jgi:hypothetical protein
VDARARSMSIGGYGKRRGVGMLQEVLRVGGLSFCIVVYYKSRKREP